MDPPPEKRRKLTSQLPPSLPRDVMLNIFLASSVETVKKICSIFPSAITIAREPWFQLNYPKKHGEETILILSDSDTEGEGWKLISTRVRQQESTSPLYTSDQLRPEMEYSRGLLCSGTTVFNPTLGISKKLPPFPLEALPVKSKVKTFMGFDQSSARYKVLGMSKEDGLSREKVYNHQILTLEMEGGSSWRQLTCNIPHSLLRFAVDCKSVCIGENLFYAAVLPENKCSVMHLNLTTERFGCNVVPHAAVVGLSYYLESGLFDFKGKVGVCFSTGGNHKVYILEDMVNNFYGLLSWWNLLNASFSSSVYYLDFTLWVSQERVTGSSLNLMKIPFLYNIMM